MSIGTSDSQPTVYHYQSVLRFSDQALATTGQSLDFRASHNSVGNAKHLLMLQDPTKTLLVARDAKGKLRYNQILYLAPLSTPDGLEFPALVADIPYTPDGGAMSWSKFRGALEYLIQTSKNMGIPLVIPEKTLLSYSQELVDYCKRERLPRCETPVTVTLAPGPSKSSYIEINNGDAITYEQQQTATAWIVNLTFLRGA